MKKAFSTLGMMAVAAMLLLTSCSTPISITSWKNPEAHATVSKVLVMGVFDKMNIIQPIETQCVDYFSGKGLPSVMALNVMNPFRQYTKEEMVKKLDSLGCDGLLLVAYKSTDVNVTTSPGFYGGYRGYWGGGSNVYVDKTYNLRAMLYATTGEALLWSGDMAVSDPDNITTAAQQLAQVVYNDWVAKQLLKNPPPPATK